MRVMMRCNRAADGLTWRVDARLCQRHVRVDSLPRRRAHKAHNQVKQLAVWCWWAQGQLVPGLLWGFSDR
jgi:hypothetical protein